MSVRILRMASPAVLLAVAGAPAAAHITLETAAAPGKPPAHDRMVAPVLRLTPKP